jgi:serine protease
VVVLLVNPANNAVINQQEVNAVNGRYSWSFSGVTQTRVQVVAGTDTDNDRLLCARGEACGAYPQLGANLTVIDLSTNRTGLDFEIVPLGGSSAAASLATVTGSGAGGSAAASVGWRLPP